MRLLDVARGSFDELQGDIFNFILRKNAEVWPIGNPDRETIWQLRLDEPRYTSDYLHDAGKHILAQKRKFSQWINSNSAVTAANTLLILCLRENKILQAQIQNRLEIFRHTGGFTENMTAERLEARKTNAIESGAPVCPKCGKPMLKRMQKKGSMQGREFWGCSDYPNCNGTRPFNQPTS